MKKANTTAARINAAKRQVMQPKFRPLVEVDRSKVVKKFDSRKHIHA